MNWLPELVIYEKSTNWDAYVDVIFNHFCTDFVSNPPTLGRRRIGIESKPEVNGKHGTFWHLISDGWPEPERNVDQLRCERIRWPRVMLSPEANGRVKMWRNSRGTRDNVLIALEDFSYVVVLVVRKGYYFLWTAYHVQFASRREKFEKEHDEFHRQQAEKAKQNAPPEKG